VLLNKEADRTILHPLHEICLSVALFWLFLMIQNVLLGKNCFSNLGALTRNNVVHNTHKLSADKEISIEKFLF